MGEFPFFRAEKGKERRGYKWNEFKEFDKERLGLKMKPTSLPSRTDARDWISEKKRGGGEQGRSVLALKKKKGGGKVMRSGKYSVSRGDKRDKRKNEPSHLVSGRGKKPVQNELIDSKGCMGGKGGGGGGGALHSFYFKKQGQKVGRRLYSWDVTIAGVKGVPSVMY